MNPSDLKLVKISYHNLEVFKNLVQSYEAEFSSLTGKLPNEFGVFKIDTFPQSPYVGYLLYHHKIPVGFCVANVENEIKDVAEFYIVPVMRKKNLGSQLAGMVFNQYPGQWQVRQIKGATDALRFWQCVIKKYTQNQFEESVVQDAHWGVVTRQRFRAVVGGRQGAD